MKLRHINKDRTDKGESSYWQLWKTLLPNINWDTHFFQIYCFSMLIFGMVPFDWQYHQVIYVPQSQMDLLTGFSICY